jgi:protein-S-isoprenylcysteine O-methyltransferase Ste14
MAPPTPAPVQTEVEPQGLTQLTAINTAKVLTILCLIGLAVSFGMPDLRQGIYLCLHISYCLWWLLEQWLYPQRRKIFNQGVGVAGFSFTLVFVGLLYALPGYLAFTNPAPIGLLEVAIALPLFIFGSLINTSADVQKMTAKQYGAELVQDGIWHFARNINYFGDLLRYLSFAVVAGSPWAYGVPALVALLYGQRMRQKDQSMSEKYPEYCQYQQSSARLIPFFW